MDYNGTLDVVTLKLANKQLKKVKASIFSDADRDYIKKWYLLKGFKDQSRFKVVVKKKSGKSWKKKGPHGGVSTKEMRYDIVLENRNSYSLEDISVEYGIFLRAKGDGRWLRDFAEALGSSQDLCNPSPVLGGGKYAEISSKAVEVLETKHARTVRADVNGGMDVFGEYFKKQEIVLEGIWVRVTTSVDGETIMREVFDPDTLRGKHDWKQRKAPSE